MRTFHQWAMACAFAFAVASAVPAVAQTGAGGQAGSGSGAGAGGGQTGTMGGTASGGGQVGGQGGGHVGGGQGGGQGQMGGTATGGQTDEGREATQNKKQDDLQKFVEKAAIDNMAEIQLGQLAQQKAQDPEVKQFAQTMIDAHTKAQSELQQAASAQGLTLPSSLDSKHQKIQDKLSKLNGADFDKQYMKVMVASHNDTRKLLEKRAGKQNASTSYGGGAATGTSGTSGTTATGTSGTGTTGTTGTSGTATETSGTTASGAAASLDSWAAATLPEVQQHLQMAKDLEKRVKDQDKNAGKNEKDNGRRQEK